MELVCWTPVNDTDAMGDVYGDVSLREGFIPAMDVKVMDDALTIALEAPGVNIDADLDIWVDGDTLFVSGERKGARDDVADEESGYFLNEIEYGSFCRSYPLPQGADIDAIEATYWNGVVQIVVPLRAGIHDGQRIEIHSSGNEGFDLPSGLS